MSEATIEFIAAARRYCKWVESKYQPDLKSTKLALELITELYLCAVRLSNEVHDDMEEEDSYSLRAKIREKFHSRSFEFNLPINYYSEIFNPIPVPAEEPVTGSLRDDITDIYRDISRGLRLFDAGYPRGAIGMWIDLMFHWGEHATSAIRVLHSYLSHELGFELN